MPIGYGPLKTPSIVGSNCKTLLPSSVSNLSRMRTPISFVTWTTALPTAVTSSSQWLPMTLTSSCLLLDCWTWAWHSSQSQTRWGTWRNSRCKWSQCRLRRFPSAVWCNALQTPCWTSATKQSKTDMLKSNFSNKKNCSPVQGLALAHHWLDGVVMMGWPWWGPYLIIVLLGHQPALSQHEVQGSTGHEHPVAQVAKHNGK